MRHAALAALITALIAVWPAHAQLFPTQPAGEAATERVLIDTTLWINPPSAPSMCMLLGQEQVTVSVHRTNAPTEPRPTVLELRGLMEDPDTNLTMAVSQDVTTQTKRVSGGRYCWSVQIQAPEAASMSMAERGAYTQTVALRITVAP